MLAFPTLLAAMARLMCDVNIAEEAELWRLENGSSPRSPALCTASWPSSPRSMEAAEGTEVDSMDETRMPAALAVLAAARAAEKAPTGMVLMPLMPGIALASAKPLYNSTVQAARRRVRGPTVMERRAEEQRLELEAAEERRRRGKRARAAPEFVQPAAAARALLTTQPSGSVTVAVARPMEEGFEGVPVRDRA